MKNLEVVIQNAAQLAEEDPEAFTMMRRVGLGASDSSVVLGVNPFPNGTVDKLIAQKRSNTITQDELDIGQLVNVRKGRDLEPIIMQKFQEQYKIAENRLGKPEAMYRIKGTPLTVNYDGILEMSPYKVPVECKFVSIWGAKYWDQGKALQSSGLFGAMELEELGDEVNNLYLTKRAAEVGIPIYYYTQLQQQLLGLDAPFGYLTALFDKDWELKTFLVMGDPKVQNKLVKEAKRLWQEVSN